LNEKTGATAQGILAVIFWGSLIAFSRSLTETLGTVTAGASIFLLAGASACAYVIVRRRLSAVRQSSRRYIFGCGALFVVYITCLYLAIGFASDRAQVLVVGLVNYLWPSLTLALAVPILKRKARLTLIPGCILGFVGVLLASAQSDLMRSALSAGNWLPYLLALVAAVCWGLYSNLAYLWAKNAESGGVPLFILASGLVLAGLRPFFVESGQLTGPSLLELVYVAIFPTILAYVFWDTAMRKGKMILVTSLAYFIPLLSTIISSIYLQVGVTWPLWIGCVLVIAGSFTCKQSIEETT